MIVKTSSIGDIVHALPAAQIVKEHCPGIQIGWVIRRRCAELLESNPFIDDLYVLDNRPNLKAVTKLSNTLKQARYEMAWDMQGLFLSGWITRLSGAPRRVGLDLNREGNRWFLNEPIVPARQDRMRHAIAILHGFLPSLDIPADVEWPPLCYLANGVQPPSEFERGSARSRTRPVALNIGASSVYKQWPTRHWRALADKIIESGRVPVLTGGPSDIDLAQEISGSSVSRKNSIINLAGRTSLCQTAAVLNRCAALVTGDTGPMHIAAALRVPTVALFGPTNPVKTGPYGTTSIILHKANCCTTNHRRPTCNGAAHCMSAISPDDAYEALAQLAKEEPAPRC